MLSKLAIELYGSPKVLIPQFDMDLKTFTRGNNQGQTSKALNTIEYDFSGPYKQFDVCSELKLDPDMLAPQFQQDLMTLLTKKFADVNKLIDPMSLNEK